MLMSFPCYFVWQSVCFWGETGLIKEPSALCLVQFNLLELDKHDILFKNLYSTTIYLDQM